jgi:hypothetical protein
MMRPPRFTAGLALAAALSVLPSPASAQETAEGPRISMRTVLLPFDEDFTIVGAAGAELVEVDAWYVEGTITPEACRKASSDTTVLPSGKRHSRWERLSNEDTFELHIGALPVNRGFSFCYRHLSALSATDSASYQGRMQKALMTALGTWMEANINKDLDAQGLKDLQQGLINQIPRADVVQPTPGGFFDPGAQATVLSTTFVALKKAFDYRAAVARNIQAKADPASNTSFASRLKQLGADATLRALVTTPEDANLPTGTRQRLAMARQLGRRLARLAEREATGVASGVSPISDPRMIAGPVNPGAATLAQATTWAANMDTTSDGLQHLRELAQWQLDRMPANNARKPYEDLHASLLLLLVDAADMRSYLRQLQASIPEVDTIIARVSAQVVARQGRNLLFARTTLANYGTRARQRISQDLGLLYTWKDGRQDAATYVGINVYPVPVNKGVPVSRYRLFDARRWSFTFGLTMNNLEQTDRFKGIIDGKAPVVGVGIRLSDFFRVSYGAPLVYTFTPDTERRKRVTAMQYTSVAIDAELRDVIKGLADALFGN